MEVRVERVSPDRLKAKPADESQLGFGKIFTDHFFNMKYSDGKGWHDAVIEGYRDICLDPAAVCLHYGQLIFEGMKAYRGKDGSIYLFRPADNFRRMNDSAERLCMPTLDVEVHCRCPEKAGAPGERVDSQIKRRFNVHPAHDDCHGGFPGREAGLPSTCFT